MISAAETKGIDQTDTGATQLLSEMLERYSPSTEERELAIFLVDAMSLLGLEAHLDAAGNAVGAIGRGARTVMLLGHMDTVPGRIPVRREGDLLHGRGAVDAKGPLAAFVIAAARLGPLPNLRVVVAGAVEEEAATSKGAYHLLQGSAPEYVIIGEPSGWSRIAVGYKGRLLVEYALTLPTSHTAGPDRSPAETAVELWTSVKALATDHNSAVTRIFDTLDATLRSFNTSGDEFAQRADMTMALRIPPGLTPQMLQGQLSSLAAEGELSFRGAEQPFRASKNNALTRAFLTAIRTNGGKPAFVVKTGTSDMNVVGPRWGCPIVAYGPGDSSLDHTPHEHISISEYLRAIQVLTEALQQLAATEHP